jgi:tetratricopeptide (TPR) repeat protein
MPGAPGFRQGWQQITNDDFDGLFATSPEIVLRGIGLAPEAFRDFHFWKGWPYDKEWAARVIAHRAAAEELCRAGRASEAASVYADLTKTVPMSDRLKTDVLDRAAQCAARAEDYRHAMELARSIPLAPFAIRRQMAVLFERKMSVELIGSFSNQAMGGAAPETSWMCPETEEVLADALYYRGIAYAKTRDLKAAEADLRTMVDKGGRLGYSPGPTVLTVAWRKLGDFYRTFLKDDAKALEAYRQALATKTNPEIRDDLAAASRSAAEILRKQGRDAEARELEEGSR